MFQKRYWFEHIGAYFLGKKRNATFIIDSRLAALFYCLFFQFPLVINIIDFQHKMHISLLSNTVSIIFKNSYHTHFLTFFCFAPVQTVLHFPL